MPSRLITKPLFEAGAQCAKRLYLDCHHPDREPAPSDLRKELAEIGVHLVDLASQAFPKGVSLAGEDTDAAVEKTRELVGKGQAGVLFHAAFRGGDAEVRADIALVNADGDLDIFEVKAGTSVKPRHVLDVALQIHAIEAGGCRVRSASILHLDSKYRHGGGKDYPVQSLFKNVDVTQRARRQLDKVKDRIASFEAMLDDESTLELPTGTWCNTPLPCPHLASCRREGPDYPLIDLPQLKQELESQLHEQGIEDIMQLDEKQEGLTLLQRRVVRAVQEGKLVVEPFVASELEDVDYPLAFVHVHWHLVVLPKLDGSRPWQKIPFAWSMRTLHQDGRSEEKRFCADTTDDPRGPCLRSLAAELREIGTMVVFSVGLDERLRSMLDDLPDLKSDLRALLQIPLLEFGNLVQHGVYHPSFGGRYDLETVSRTLLAEGTGTDDIPDDEAADRAFRRIAKSRTRQTTRKTLAGQLSEYAARQTQIMLDLYHHLRTVRQPDASAQPK